MHWIYVYTRLSQYALWMIINFLFTSLQRIWWKFNGVSDTLKKANKHKNYAQILKIRGKFKFCDYLSPASKWDFLATHERFKPLEYVLQDHITLYSVTESEVIFVEAEPGQKVWDTKNHSSFFMRAQFTSSRKIVSMSIESFQKLAEQVGDPKGKLIFFGNCTRCGSTLLIQMFNATDKIISFGEPNFLNFLSKTLDQLRDPDEVVKCSFERLAKSTIRLLCKQTQSGQEIAYVIKICAPAIVTLPVIVKLFPNSKHMFLYRNPIKVAQSLCKLSHVMYSERMKCHFGLGSAWRYSMTMGFLGYPQSPYRVQVTTHLAFSMWLWFSSALQYLKYKQTVPNYPAIRYEDIIKNPTRSLQIIFSHCNLPLELVPKALEALKWDSQKDTSFSSDVMKKFPTLPYEGKAKEECDQIAKSLEFPTITEYDYILEDTITVVR